MKRIGMFVAIFMTMFTLAACDLIPEDVFDEVTDVISKELCEDDPDNVLCSLDTIEDLEDLVVLNLVEGFQEGYLSEDFAENCELFISPSNPELLDACITKELELLPPDILEFTPETVEQEDDTYIIKGSHDLHDYELMIYLTVVQIDARYYIEEYSYSFEMISMESPDQDQLDFFEKYFIDLGDRTIDNETFCSIYYDGVDDDCNGIRSTFLEEVIEVLEVEAIAVVGSSVHGHVTVLKGKEDPDVPLDALLEATINEEGQMTAGSFTVGDIPTQEEFASLIDSMLADYLNPNLSDEEFNEMHGGILNSENELSNRSLFIGNKLVYKSTNPVHTEFGTSGVSVLFQDEDQSIHVVTVYLSATSFARKGYTYYKSFGLDNDCDGIDDDCDGGLDKENALAVYSYYLTKYLDSDSDDDGLLDLIGEQSSKFFEIRQEVLNNKTNIVVIDIVGPIAPDTYVIITDNIDPSGSSTRKHEPVRIISEIDKATPMLSFGDPDDEGLLQTKELNALLELFVIDYNDQTLKSEDVCKMFVSREDVDSCVDERQKDMEDGVLIDSIDIVNGHDLVLRKRPGRTTYSNITLKSGYLVDPGDDPKIDFTKTLFNDYEMFINEQVEMFIEKINDLTLESDMVCMYVDMTSAETCQALRDNVDSGIMIAINEIELVESVYVVKLDMIDADGEESPLGEYKVFIVYDDGMNKLNLTPLR